MPNLTKAQRYNKKLDAIFDKYHAQEKKKAECPHLVMLKHFDGYQCPECYYFEVNK